MKQYRDVQLPTVFNSQGQLHVLKILGPGNVIKLNHLSYKDSYCFQVALRCSAALICLSVVQEIPSCVASALYQSASELYWAESAFMLTCMVRNSNTDAIKSLQYVHVPLKLNNCTEYLKCTDRPFVGTDVLILNSPVPLYNGNLYSKSSTYEQVTFWELVRKSNQFISPTKISACIQRLWALISVFWWGSLRVRIQ